MVIRGSKEFRRRASKFILNNSTFPFRTSIQHALGFQPATSVLLKESDAPHIKIRGPSNSKIRSPRWLNRLSKVHDTQFSAINAYMLDETISSAYSSVLVKKNNLLLPNSLPSVYGRVQTASGQLFKLSPFDIFVKHRGDSTIPRGIHIGGSGVPNWYHFIIECLPKVLFSLDLPSEYEDFPLILPEACKSIPAFTDAITALNNKRPLYFNKRNSTVTVSSLITFDDVSIGPYKMIPGEWPRVDDYSQHDEALMDFIGRFRHHFVVDSSTSFKSRRIFLARPEGRRDYNQTELLGISKRYGFEPLYPEKISLAEQAKIFSEASVIVGPSGAAWVGMIFCSRPIFGLSWLPSVYKEFSSYSSLAHLLGHDLSFVLARTKKEIETTGEAYTAGYSVDPSEFEAALSKVMNEALS